MMDADEEIFQVKNSEEWAWEEFIRLASGWEWTWINESNN